MARTVRIAHLDTAVSAQAGTAMSASRWWATNDGIVPAGDSAWHAGYVGGHPGDAAAPAGDTDGHAGAGRRHGADTLTILRRHAPEAQIRTIAVAPDGPVVVRLLRALTWAVQERVDVVSISLGLPEDNVVLAPTLERLWRAGTLVVAAAGNKGPGRLSQPAADPHVLAVGACDDRGRVQRYSGSAIPDAGYGCRPEVLAESTDGTSGACARVSGVAADLLARHRPAGRTAHDVAVALQQTALPVEEADLSRAAAGQIDQGAADALLAGGEPLPRRQPAVGAGMGARYVDPRLRWLLEAGDPGHVVRSVAVIDGETVVLDRRRAEYARVLADQRVTALSAPDVPAWTLTCTEELANGIRLPVTGAGARTLPVGVPHTAASRVWRRMGFAPDWAGVPPLLRAAFIGWGGG